MHRLIPLLLLVGLVPTPAAAKCAFAKYTVEGTVEIPAGVEHNQIKIYLFLEGMGRTSDYPARAGSPEYVVPDSDGQFEVEAWLNTFSSRTPLIGDRCRKVVKYGDLFIVGEFLRARRLHVNFGESKRQIRRELDVSSRVPRVYLTKLAPPD